MARARPSCARYLAGRGRSAPEPPMTAVLLTILAMTVAGLPLTIAIDRTARGPLLLGLSFLYGNAAAMFSLMLLSVLHIPWTAVSATVTLLLWSVALIL